MKRSGGASAEAGVKKPQLSSGDRIRGKSGRIKLIRRITLHFFFFFAMMVITELKRGWYILAVAHIVFCY